jgi:CII-binding regulator of phage lambda lysogenization HflD
VKNSMTTSGAETAALRLVISSVNKLNPENINAVFSNSVIILNFVKLFYCY